MTGNLLIKLLPFLISCIVYFALKLPEPSALAALVKCFPTLYLAFLVAIQSHSAGAWTPYSRRVFQGLLLSAVGDACLVWPQLFLPGLAAFAACHISYILAFGLTPFRPLVFVVAVGAVFVAYIYLVMPCLNGISLWAETASKVPLSMMAWRALSHPGRQLSTSFGSLLFFASDLFYGIETFCSFLPHSRFLIMSTYYTAQALFTFSVASQKAFRKES
ncbi:lysoplasmalogenase-like [Sceloporus undulatus]|uniref:lysoplasmalogenase-like n=1 Tax=Sceloporus undulatus TaxID=8520 RepID=UPI001C4B38F7|nr:lysoplasmalogenase-like [Sceloporus undulatus]